MYESLVSTPRGRIFVRTAVALVVSPFVLSFITQVLYLPVRWWGWGLNLTWLMPFLSILDGVNSSFGSVVAIHIAIWWQCRTLHQSGWGKLAGLIVGYAAVFWTLPQVSQWITEGFQFGASQPEIAELAMPPGYQWLSFGYTVMMVPWYLIMLSTVAPLAYVRAKDTLTGETSANKQPQWSIRGMMLATALVAIAVAIQQIMNRMFSQHYELSDTIFLSTNQLVVFLLQASFYLAHCMVVCLALRSVDHAIAEWLFRKTVMNKTSIACVVALSLLSATLTIVSFPSESFFDLFSEVGNFVAMVLNHSVLLLGSYLTLYLVSIWVFRRWQQAGYRLELFTAWRSR